jgi:hypothetical protein
MKRKALTLLAGLLLLARAARADDDWLDSLDDALRASAFGGNVTAEITGLLDLEGYSIQQPALGLYTEGGNALFAPRLTLNLDAQITPAIYAFAEVRVDRGFDPADRNLEARFDSYAISYQPWHDLPVQIQAGKFASVVGTYAERYDSWSNPFINAPLPYENRTGVFGDSAPNSAEQFSYERHATDDAYGRVPIMWGPSYASGVAMFGQIGQLSLSAEVKNASLSSPPDAWDLNSHGLSHPTWSGHAYWQPSPAWRFGMSGSVGPYFRPGTSGYGYSGSQPVFPSGKGFDDYDESTITQDVTFAWRHWQLWAECFETRFDVPEVGNADTLAYYVEGKYKFTPQLFAALRWNQQLFSTVPVNEYESGKWGSDTWRIDAAITYRWTPRIQTKLQYSFTDQTQIGRQQEHLVAGQITVRF